MSRDKYRALENSAAAYENTVISGWEGLYREKQRRLIEAFAPYMRGNNALELGVADGEMSVRLAAFFPGSPLSTGPTCTWSRRKRGWRQPVMAR